MATAIGTCGFTPATPGKLRPGLTLNFGLRYQPVTTPTEVNRFEIIPYPCDCNNLAPLFGFAWQMPKGWGVLRGGYSVQYGEIYPVTFQQVRFDPPWNHKVSRSPRPAWSNPQSSVTDALGYGLLLSPEHGDAVRALLQFQLGALAARQPGACRPATSAAARTNCSPCGTSIARTSCPASRRPPPPSTSAVPTPTMADYRLVLNGSDAYYDAGRVSLVLPRWRNLTMDLSYWYSKAIDLGSSYTNTAYDADSRIGRSQSEFETHKDLKARSEFDQPHAFLWHASYTTPKAGRLLGGWTAAAVVLLKNGTPVTVVSGSDSPGFGNVDGNGGDRPNLLDPTILGRTIGNPDTSVSLLPKSAFSFIQPTDPAGSLGRQHVPPRRHPQCERLHVARLVAARRDPPELSGGVDQPLQYAAVRRARPGARPRRRTSADHQCPERRPHLRFTLAFAF